MPQQPETEEEVLELIVAERRARVKAGYPQHVVESTDKEVREAFAEGWEFVGRLGGLRWSAENGWE